MTDRPHNEESFDLQEPLRQRLDELLRGVDALPTLDSRTADEILDYDENGLPR
jgi:hypothetical protein